MSTKTENTAQPAESRGHVPELSRSESGGSLPGYVIDALELPRLYRWFHNDPGDTVAGALVRWGERQIPKLNNPDEFRTVPVAILHGITITSAGESTPDGYVEVAGFSTVLDRHLRRLHDAEQGTLVRITYTGHQESPTKGHNAYADFEVSIGRRSDQVPLEVITDAPDIRELEYVPTMGELDQGEPF